MIRVMQAEWDGLNIEHHPVSVIFVLKIRKTWINSVNLDQATDQALHYLQFHHNLLVSL